MQEAQFRIGHEAVNKARKLVWIPHIILVGQEYDVLIQQLYRALKILDDTHIDFVAPQYDLE